MVKRINETGNGPSLEMDQVKLRDLSRREIQTQAQIWNT